METPGGEGSAGRRSQTGNMLKSMSRTPKPAGLPKPGKSDAQKTTNTSKVAKPDATKPAGVLKLSKPPEKVQSL
jgi:hypothetical protein